MQSFLIGESGGENDQERFFLSRGELSTLLAVVQYLFYIDSCCSLSTTDIIFVFFTLIDHFGFRIGVVDFTNDIFVLQSVFLFEKSIRDHLASFNFLELTVVVVLFGLLESKSFKGSNFSF